ncbi:MAG: hypothetical protein GQ570_03790 [Helicobacteraceae bacterium]|nr:hypothetical protein [Helicobacteraceae bacterium]
MNHQIKYLDQVKKKPFFSKINISDIPLGNVVDTMVKAESGLGTKSPDAEALAFYLMNHAYMLSSADLTNYEPTGKHVQIIDTYLTEGTRIFQRLFYYMLLICTRESRHVHSSNNLMGDVLTKYGSDIHSFLDMIRGGGSSSAANKLRISPPKVTLGEYTDYLEWMFYNGSFSGGYGGSAWGDVAKCLNNYVQGNISAEVMVDTGFTLAHNNGPIFNKGMLYTGYSNEFGVLLDVQRAGQMPRLVHEQLILSHAYIASLVPLPVEVSKIYTEAVMIHKDSFKGIMDWEEVHNLGALNNLNSYKAKFKKFHPTMVVTTEAYKDSTQYYYVTPTTKVKTLTRKQLLLG